MDEKYDWMIVCPQPFSRDKKYNKRIKGPTNPDRIEFSTKLDGYVFYEKDQAICMRQVVYPGTLGIVLQEDGLWYWKIEKEVSINSLLPDGLAKNRHSPHPILSKN